MRTWVLITRKHVKSGWGSTSCFPGIGWGKGRWIQGSWCLEMVSSRFSNGSSFKIMWGSDSGNHPYQPLVPTDLKGRHMHTQAHTTKSHVCTHRESCRVESTVANRGTLRHTSHKHMRAHTQRGGEGERTVATWISDEKSFPEGKQITCIVKDE